MYGATHALCIQWKANESLLFETKDTIWRHVLKFASKICCVFWRCNSKPVRPITGREYLGCVRKCLSKLVLGERPYKDFFAVGLDFVFSSWNFGSLHRYLNLHLVPEANKNGTKLHGTRREPILSSILCNRSFHKAA
jgi:hypothetical protein